MPRVIQRTYVITRVLALRDKLIKATRHYLHTELTAESYGDFVGRFHRLLGKDIPRDIVHESLLHLAGHKLLPEQLVNEAWRLAGNLDRLKRFHASPPWNRQVADEYVPVQVISWFNQYRKGKPYVEFSLRVLAGTPAPLVLKKVWSPKFCSLLATSLGFSKPWAEHRFDDPRQFMGLRFYVLIEQRLCGALPDFENLWMNDKERIKPVSCYTQNRELIKLRNRVLSHYPCPAGLHTDVECHHCVQGLEHCSLAVHDKTFQKRKCRRCGNENWFDPQRSVQVCIKCFDLQLRGDL